MLSIFPNPVKAGSTLIILSERKIGSVELKNVQGEIILRRETQNEIKLPSSISPGTYVISLFFENEIVQQSRIVVY